MSGRWWWPLSIERGGSGVVCGGRGLWSPFVLVSARLVFIIVLAIGGPWVLGGDGAHLSMCVDGGGGRCRSNMVVAGSTSELVNAPSSFVGPEVSGCLLCGQSGAFWVMVGSHHSWVAVVSISRQWQACVGCG